MSEFTVEGPVGHCSSSGREFIDKASKLALLLAEHAGPPCRCRGLTLPVTIRILSLEIACLPRGLDGTRLILIDRVPLTVYRCEVVMCGLSTVGWGQLLFRNVRYPVGLVERKLLYMYSPLPHLALPRGEADLHGLFQGQSGPLLPTTSESVVCVHGARSLLRLRYRETDSPQSIFLTVPLPL